MFRKAIVSTTALLIMTGAAAAGSTDVRGTKTTAGVTHSNANGTEIKTVPTPGEVDMKAQAGVTGNGAEVKDVPTPGEIDMKKDAQTNVVVLPNVEGGSPDAKGTRTTAGVTHGDNNGTEVKNVPTPGEVNMKRDAQATIDVDVKAGNPDAKGTRTTTGVTHSND